MALSGTYRFVRSDNKEGEVRAMFNNKLSEEDFAIFMSPQNVASCALQCTGDGYTVGVTYSKKPEFNGRLEYKFGVEKALPAPYCGKSVATRTGNVLKEVVTYDDNTYTWTTTTSPVGAKMTVESNKDGYIASSFWERVDVSVCGFYVLESHKNMDKVFMKDGGVSQAEATEMCSYMAMRITEEHGIYTIVDFLGNGAEKKTVFALDAEVEVEVDQLGITGTQVVSMPAPGEMRVAYIEPSKKTCVWKGSATAEGITWSIEKPLNGVSGSATYRRMADPIGTWKVLTNSNMDTFMRALGTPEDKVQDYVNERPLWIFTHMGKGVWEYKTNSHCLKMDPLLYRSGEETSYEIEGKLWTECMTFTKDGALGGFKSGNLTGSYTMKIMKNFIVCETSLEGHPEATYTIMLARA